MLVSSPQRWRPDVSRSAISPTSDTGALTERENATCKQRLRSSVAAEPRVELIATLGGAIADRIYDGLIEDLAHLRGTLAPTLGTIGANASS